MNAFKRFGLVGLGLVLVGQGCLGGGSSVSDGALWKSETAGDEFAQLSALPEITGVSSIAGTNVTAFEIDPSDSSMYYLGTDKSGLFYSSNFGDAWSRPEDSRLKTGMIVDVEVDPNDVCTVYVARLTDVLKTTDCMRSFKVVYTEAQAEVTLRDLVVDWFNPNILWLGTTSGAILKSNDGAGSWSLTKRIADQITGIVVSNSDSRIVLVGSEDKGIWRTTDGGSTWVELADTMKKTFKDSDEVRNFAQTRRGDVILANTKSGLLRSTDQGANWELITTIAPSKSSTIWTIDIAPDNANVIYYAAVGALYVSENAGASWETKELPSVRAPRVLRVHPSGPANILMGFVTIES